MITINEVKAILARGAAGLFVLAVLATGAGAQDTTTTSINHGVPSYDTQVKNAEVVYVEGNDLVLRLDAENGKIEHLLVPDSDKFTIDGKEVTVHELATGTKLTQTITTATAPHYVTTIRTLKGKVWHVSPPKSVILTLPDGTNHLYRIPSDAKVMVGGKQKTPFELRKGMIMEATIITDEPHTVLTHSKEVVGQAAVDSPATPQELGFLLFLQPSIQPLDPPVTSVSTEQLSASVLPKTGTLLPLAGMLGALSLAISLGLGAVRRSFIKG